uniref:Mannosyltransferase n=1 Tax=Ciona savignyi TaxID=51511 RepID=H2Y571_CIOSA
MLYVLPAIIVSVYVFLCPYTKVEESFNIQAIHDVMYHRQNVSNYDHQSFPGVVPRTFIGPIFIALLSAPSVYVSTFFTQSKIISQYLVRISLGLCVVYGLHKFTRALKSHYDSSTSKFFVLIVSSQFHLLFYASRPLPNIFAICLVLLALASWIRNENQSFIWYSAGAIIMFRFELCILLGTCLLMSLLRGKIGVKETILTALPAGIVILGLSTLVDSYAWGRWLWAEGDVMWYNVVLNKSSNWGTSPFHWYLTSVLPRALLTANLFVFYGLWTHPYRSFSIIIPASIFILIFSILPHKELRFIIYTFPMFDAIAAAGYSYIFTRRNRSKLYAIFSLFSMACIIVNMLASIVLLSASLHNYPGGEILQKLHDKVPCTTNQPVHVHISNLAAQTGISHFGEQCKYW